MKKTKKILCTLLLCALVLTSFAPVGNASAKGKVKLSTTKMVTAVHYKYSDLFLENVNNYDDIKWKSSNNKIATVNSYGGISPKKTGTVTITAIYKNKKYNCKVTIINAPKINVISVKKMKSKIKFKIKNNMKNKITFYSNGAFDDVYGLSPAKLVGNKKITINSKKTKTISLTTTKKSYFFIPDSIRVQTKYKKDSFLIELTMKRGKAKLAGNVFDLNK